MQTLVIFYSYTGNTRRLARKAAEMENADLFEVKIRRTHGKLHTYVIGSLAALRRKTVPIEPITADLKRYDRFIVMGPIWAGYPAPAVNSMLDALPSGKSVEVRMVSASGESRAKDAVLASLAQKGTQSAKYQDIKA